MKKIINGRLAAAMFAAPFIIFSLLVASCGQSAVQGSASPDAGSKKTTATASIVCQGKNCPALKTASSTDTTQGGGIRKYSFVATVDYPIEPGTQFQIEVVVRDEAAH